LSVTWTGAAGTPAGGSHTTTPAPISNIGREIPIPTSVVAFNLGKAVTVTYTIIRSGATSTPSQPLTLPVQAIPNEDGALPTPAIEGAVGNELNIGTLIGTENLRIAAWPLQLSGQMVWLRYDGTDTAGDATYRIIWAGLPHHYTGELVYLAPHAWLKTLKDGTDLKVTFRVNFDKVSNAATAVTFPIRTYTVRELALIKPTLDSVKGSPSGEEIPDNGYTVETAVTLSGTATKGLEVEVFDGATSKGKATANATTGIWTLSVSGLSETAHRFTAKALYGSGEVSAARAINVTALIKPTLDKVADAGGQDIPEADTTISTTLTLSGKASNGQRVEIYEGNGAGAVSHGIATAHATTGDWQHQVTLAQGARRLYAQSRYHSSTVYTNVRHLTIVLDVAPTLTSVKGSPSGEDIPDGGNTVETAVTLSGTASKGQKVEVFDGATSKGQATADKSTGVWSLLVSGLSETVHRFKAKALYGTGVESAERTFTVEADADAPVFTNGPYAIQPGGTFKDIILSLQTGSGTPVPNADITLVLPAGFTYADGASGSRVFRTGTDGLATISGVKGPGAPGSHNVTATYRSKTATARLAIVGLVGTIAGISMPTRLANSPNGQYVFVNNAYGSSISVIDTAKFSVTKTINVGSNPSGIACSPNGAFVVVCNYGDSLVSIIDAVNLVGLRTIPVSGAFKAAFSHDGTLVFVTGFSGSYVTVINTATWTVIKTIYPGSTSDGIARSIDGTHMFVANTYSSSVAVISVADLEVINTINNVGERPAGVTCAGGHVFVSDGASSIVTRIDAASFTVVDTLNLGGRATDITTSPDGSCVFVSKSNSDTIAVIDAASFTLRMSIAGIRTPYGLSSSPDGSRIFVCNGPANTVSVITVG
jgi:YVTN family beta-propeller protein